MVRRESRDEGERTGAGPHSRLQVWPLRRATGLGIVALAALVVVLVALLLGGGQATIRAHLMGIRGRAQLQMDGGHGKLTLQGLTPPPSGEVYEVWLEPAHSPPLPTQILFTASSLTVRLPGSLNGISRVLVTPEPAAGSLSPTGPTVIVARLN